MFASCRISKLSRGVSTYTPENRMLLCSRALPSNVSRVLVVSLAKELLPNTSSSLTHDASILVTCPLEDLKKRDISLATGFMSRSSEIRSAKVAYQ